MSIVHEQSWPKYSARSLRLNPTGAPAARRPNLKSKIQNLKSGACRLCLAIPLATACRGAAPVAEAPLPIPATQPVAQPPTVLETGDLDDRPLYTFSEQDLDRYLKTLHDREPDFIRRVMHLARKNIGQPYQMYLLGEYPYELYDPDPMYCLSKSDCVTFTEHTYAMALGRDWACFFGILQRLRYKDGVVGMLTRNHFTIADWDHNNSFLLEDITQQLGAGRAWTPMREVVKRAKFFAKHGIGQDLPDQAVESSYIPKDKVPEILGELRDADVVHIIRGEKGGEWAGHVGLIALADGVAWPSGSAQPDRAAMSSADLRQDVHFLHSAEPAVREQPLLDYIAKDRRCCGIKILRPREGAQSIMDQEMTKFSRDPQGSANLQKPSASNSSTISAGRGISSSGIPRLGVPLLLSSGLAMSDAPSSQPVTTQRAPSPKEVGDSKTANEKPTMQDYRLEFDTPSDPQLQAELEAIDRKLGEEHGIKEADRACGVLDLTDLRLAMVRPDAMFYGASVPKIGILLGYFETHPEAAVGVAPDIERELQLMIKRSDNDMAARYSQIVGLKAIQGVLQSDKYRLYTREHGGLWCGKHYGIDQPRTGDPVHDHSHAATVRQCLRYYLMLEQGRLVNPRACEKMKSIFAAPLLDFHNDNFVKGLNGRDVTMIRKSGEWEDWHLDTARIQHGDRTYLIAAMTHHPKGREYLAGLAAAVDESLCGTDPPKRYSHRSIIHVDRKDAEVLKYRQMMISVRTEGEQPPMSQPTDPAQPNGRGVYESPEITNPFFFNEVLPSWNMDIEPGAAFVAEIRVGRTFDDSWSPYLAVGAGGTSPPPTDAPELWELGRIDTDYFTSLERFDRVQFAIHVYGNAEERAGLTETDSARVAVRRFSLCLSDTTGIPNATRPAVPTRQPLDAERWQRRLPVPHLGQGTDRPEMESKICSPASVAMVLNYRGVKATPEEVADRAFDPIHKLYGNWPCNVQAAYTYGVPGYITRFSDWAEVERMIADDQPLVISIRFNEGEMPSAPMKSTDGHLIVICGFDAEGKVLVNDPARSDPEKGQYACRREELDKAWLAHGGTAYVLLAK